METWIKGHLQVRYYLPSNGLVTVNYLPSNSISETAKVNKILFASKKKTKKLL